MPGRIQQAAIDLNKKLRLEAQFRPNVARTFSAERKIYQSTILQTGSSPVRSQISDIWDITLQLHYQRVAVQFLKGVTASLERIRLEKELSRLASIRTSQITVTSINDMISSTNLAVSALGEENLEPSKRAIALTGGNILRTKQARRAPTITTTETQSSAEVTKSQVAFQEQLVKKVWITVRDSKVRATHIAVDGIELGEREFFTVGSSKLLHPGDYSMNPAIKEVANCRCACIYS